MVMVVSEIGRWKHAMNMYVKDQKFWMHYGFGGKFVYFVYFVNILQKWYEMFPNCIAMILISKEFENIEIGLEM